MSENTKIQLHVLSSDTIDEDLSLIQIPRPDYDDSVEISSTNRKYTNILIDSGASSSAPAHIAKLTALEVMRIDAIILTSYTGGHMGGLYQICENFDVSNTAIYLPATAPSDYISHASNVHGLAEYKQMTIITPTEQNHSFDIGELNLDFKNCDIDQSANVYDAGLCCIVTYGKTRIGFLGDMGLKTQENLTGKIGHLDLMSVENHGMSSGHYRPFFDSIAPKMCFTQNGDTANGGIADGINYLAERCKTHAYLQENGIPNFATSINGDITFDIYKTGVSTKANAIKYANGIKGATSIVGAINDNVPGYGYNGSETDKKINLSTILKNMEHGTFLSTRLTDNVYFYELQENLLSDMIMSDVKDCELIIYKGNSSLYNGDKLGKTVASNNNLKTCTESGYIILIPHTVHSLSGMIFSHWEATEDFEYINWTLKPLNNIEHFKFVKLANEQKCTTFGFNTNFLEPEGLSLLPKDDCLVNYTMWIQNQSSSSQQLRIGEGDGTRTITVPQGKTITLSNVVLLESDKEITIPDTQGVYIRISGFVTYPNAKAKPYDSQGDYFIEKLPCYNQAPIF